MKIKPKHWMALERGEKLPRKLKKTMLGLKISRKALKERLSKVVVTQNKYPQSADISDRFCPKCGCDVSISSGNLVEYPERWVKIRCARCGFLVGYSDNSPYYHCLEFKEFNYEIP